MSKRNNLAELILTHFGLGGIDTFCDQKIRHEKLRQFIKILNSNKSPCIRFCTKLFKLKYFGLEMSLLYGVLAHFEFKIHKDFKTISSIWVKNCFRYFQIHILRQMFQKNPTKIF